MLSRRISVQGACAWQSAHDRLVAGAVQGKGELQSFQDSCAAADIVVAEGLQDEVAAEKFLHAAAAVPTLVTLGCAQSLEAAMRLGGISATDSGYRDLLWKAFVCNGAAKGTCLWHYFTLNLVVGRCQHPADDA